MTEVNKVELMGKLKVEHNANDLISQYQREDYLLEM